MKCARLHLQERTKCKVKPDTSYSSDKPLRYCQKRMINPEHQEDPRWTDIYDRYHCYEDNENTIDTIDSGRENPNTEDLFLSVQTLKFQGNVEQPQRSRSSFKYKSPSTGATHRMFVKQVIADDDDKCSDDGRSSQLTCYYFDDYAKYLFNNDKSRPTSGKSSIFLQSLGNKKENKTTQVDEQTGEGSKKTRHGINESKVKTLLKTFAKQDIKDEIKNNLGDIEDSKITFRKSGRRKSLTISRNPSPETVQVIRVDVVCNNSRASALSDYDDKKSECNIPESIANFDIESINLKKSHFASKYLLTNTIKTLDENLCGGEKVTLLCKTFKLSERSQALSNKPKASFEVKTNCKKNLHKGFKIKIRK